jgi:hypothetical protein
MPKPPHTRLLGIKMMVGMFDLLWGTETGQRLRQWSRAARLTRVPSDQQPHTNTTGAWLEAGRWPGRSTLLWCSLILATPVISDPAQSFFRCGPDGKWPGCKVPDDIATGVDTVTLLPALPL